MSNGVLRGAAWGRNTAIQRIRQHPFDRFEVWH